MGNGSPPAAPHWSASECGMFTIKELMAIHRDLRSAPWQPEAFYNERREVVRKLDDFFNRLGAGDAHLQGKNL